MLKVAVFLVFTVLTVVFATEGIDERKPGYCYWHGVDIKEDGKFVPAPIGDCSKVKCLNASTNSIAKLTCATSVLSEGCTRSQKDLTKPYPECCPKIICNEE